MDGGRTRAWARGRRNRLISTICRRRWQHDNATGAVALLRSGYALPARGHGASKTDLSTGGKATYRDRNAVAENRATSFTALRTERLGSPGHTAVALSGPAVRT